MPPHWPLSVAQPTALDVEVTVTTMTVDVDDDVVVMVDDDSVVVVVLDDVERLDEDVDGSVVVDVENVYATSGMPASASG